MCNRLHTDSEPIPPTGVGWKLVFLGPNGGFRPWYHRTRPWEADPDGWIRWKSDYCGGFCFFLTEEEALRAKEWVMDDSLIAKIEYAQGLGAHTEHRFLGPDLPIFMALCCEFRFLS